MQDLPLWIEEFIRKEKPTCINCDRVLMLKNLISVGIQRNAKVKKDKLCLGMNCSECGELTLFEIKEMGLLDLAYDVWEEASDNMPEDDFEPPSKNKSDNKKSSGKMSSRNKKSKSKITIKETHDIKRFLNNIKYHEDMLIAMGMTPEEIDKFVYKKIDKGNNDNEQKGK